MSNEEAGRNTIKEQEDKKKGIKLQVGIEHYSFERYMYKGRWMSYYYQVSEAMKAGCKTFLYIGKGDGLVVAVLKELLKKSGVVDTLDFDAEMYPTYVGDIKYLDKIVDKKYDCVICCQVLEHIDWKYFEKIIRSIRKICEKKFILSLPQRKKSYGGRIDISFFHLSCEFVFPKYFEKKLPPCKKEHLWEVNIKQHRRKDILSIVKKYFCIEGQYVVAENTYHWFVIGIPY